MPRPKIRPVTAETAATGQAAIESFSAPVFVPEGAATYSVRGGRQGRRWSARLQIEQANVSVGGTKDKPNDNEAVFYLRTKALPLAVDADKAVPVGTTYHLRMRVNYDKLADGDSMTVRNQAVFTSLFAALGTKVTEVGLSEDIIDSAFPEKESTEPSTLLGSRVVVSLSLNPPKEGSEGTGFLNVDRFLPDIE